MMYWSVPQYAKQLTSKPSALKHKLPPPLNLDDEPLSASWPNMPTSRSVQFLSSSPAPSFCTARSGDGSARSSGAWWEAAAAGGAAADAPQPGVASSPGAARSPAAARMLSRMLSVLPEGADELAHTQSLRKSVATGAHATAAPHACAAASGAAGSRLPRASSSEMTIVKKHEPVGATPLRFVGSTHVNRNFGAAGAAPAPWAAESSTAARRSGAASSSGESRNGSSAASTALVVAAPARASATGSTQAAPSDPRIGMRRAGAAGASSALHQLPAVPPSPAPGALPADPLQPAHPLPADPLQPFDSVFSGLLSSRSGNGNVTMAEQEGGARPESHPPACLPVQGSGGGEQPAVPESRSRPPHAFGLARPPHNQRSRESGSDGSINFMYTMRDVSRSLVVNQNVSGVPQPTPEAGAVRADDGCAVGGARTSRREFLTGHTQPATSGSSTVDNNSGNGQETGSGLSSAEIEVIARNAAAAWRRHGPQESRDASRAGVAQLNKSRMLQRSVTGLRHSSRQMSLRADRAVEAAKDPSWCVHSTLAGSCPAHCMRTVGPTLEGRHSLMCVLRHSCCERRTRGDAVLRVQPGCCVQFRDAHCRAHGVPLGGDVTHRVCVACGIERRHRERHSSRTGGEAARGSAAASPCVHACA